MTTDAVDINSFLGFLRARLDRYGRPIRELFTQPEAKEEGWFRLPWAAHHHDSLPAFTLGEHTPAPQAQWMEAWH
eukprot:2475191-Alexandrium_andersonii.AAC.1